MPSIRRSIVAYFLVLLGLTLLAIGLLTDRLAGEAVRAREISERKRISQEFEFRQQEVAHEFDQKLLAQAQTLAGEFRRTYLLLTRRDLDDMQKFRAFIAVMPVGDIGVGPAALTSLLAVHHPTVRGPAFGMLAWASRVQDIRHTFESVVQPDFFQFHIPRWKQIIRAPRQTVDFPADVESHGLNDAQEHQFDTVSLPGVGRVRRVIYRTNLLISPRPFPTPSRGGGQRTLDRDRPGMPFTRDMPRTDFGKRPESVPRNYEIPRPETPPFERPEPYSGTGTSMVPVDVMFPPFFIQSGYRESELGERISGLAATRDAQLEEIRNEIATSLTWLRTRVFLISMMTFLSLAVGGWLIVGAGLAPVRNLSDAAGRVSEKDFRLPVDPRDLSVELLPIYDRLTQSFEALRQAFEREKQAVQDISHELRTPVAALLATLEVALRKSRSADDYRATLEDCRMIARQLGGLIERVMTLAYLDAGQSGMSFRDADAVEVAEGCAAVIRPLAEAHGLTLTANLDDTVELHTDPDKLREVLMNLLHNAVEYNRPGGRVELSVQKLATGGALLEVNDTGIGMSSDTQGRIFERFYRADPSRTATGAHAGLGLAIVKEYLTRMGGRVEVRSELGAGSTFRITLPDHGATT